MEPSVMNGRHPSPARVSERHLQRLAGVLVPPPAMLAAIQEWVLAVVAAREIASKEVGLKAVPPDRSELQAALERLRLAPTSYPAYKEVHDLAWAFGHPGERWSIRDFQKPTPERTAELTTRMERFIARLEARIDGEVAAHEAQTEKLRGELATLRSYTRPGVTAPPSGGKPLHKAFPVDLTGWRYGEQELMRRIEERARIKARDMLDAISSFKNPEAVKEFEDIRVLMLAQAETGRGYFDEIHVLLQNEPIKGAMAYWQPATHQLVVALPIGARPWELDTLASTLRHELQHFAQTYLEEVMGGGKPGSAGRPSLKVQTPEFNQRMNPSHPSYRAEDPEVRALTRRLREQGVDPRRVNFHDLDDVEYFTNLADAMDAFRKVLGHGLKENPNGPVREALRVFTGAGDSPHNSPAMNMRMRDEDFDAAWLPYGGYGFIKHFSLNPFLGTLKRHAPGKWRKAVGELVREFG